MRKDDKAFSDFLENRARAFALKQEEELATKLFEKKPMPESSDLNLLVSLLENKIDFVPKREICLPNGQFASFRQIYAVDMVAAIQGMSQPINSIMLICKILVRVCRIDGEEKSVAYYMGLPMDDFLPLSTYVNDYITSLSTKGVG